MTQPTLADPIAVGCFFRCGTVIRDFDPRSAHDQMERHYDDEHGEDLIRILKVAGYDSD